MVLVKDLAKNWRTNSDIRIAENTGEDIDEFSYLDILEENGNWILKIKLS